MVLYDGIGNGTDGDVGDSVGRGGGADDVAAEVGIGTFSSSKNCFITKALFPPLSMSQYLVKYHIDDA